MEVFDAFDYVALGHIHSPQHVQRENVLYCGTPLKYSFSEAEQEKSVTVAELKEKGNVEIRRIPLKPLRDMRRIRGTYMEVTDRSFYQDTNTEDYVQITLTDEEDVLDAVGRLRVIYRGTDLGAFNPHAVASARVEALRRSWGVAPHERVVLLAARLTAWKGHRLLIEAAARMREQGVPDLAVILAGDPQGRSAYEREIDALVAARGLEGIVRRVGHCTDMPAAFRAASVVAVPSIEPEAFGRSAVEAQALGTPVVVSDLGAVPETVLAPPDVPPGQRTGWRVPPGDAPALAAALTEALALGASARDALARRCRAHVEANFSLERMVGDTLAVYAELLGRDG